ncbi:MAG: baseplate protein [Gammaproteobacteria bacterium]|nr:baseplate protein [Gammaproteobacteria bacterium]
MPLPKISTPTYELVLPSTNKKVKYRPFLVKEEKILIMALESEDQKQITNAIKTVLADCILTRGIKVDKMATFDIEYLFLNVRGKSVGETVEVNVTCPDDGKTTVEMEIDIDSIKIQKDPNHSNIIKLDNDLSIQMNYPSLNQFIETNFDLSDTKNQVDQSLHVIMSCINQVYNSEESWSAAECTKKELKDFVESMNSKQFKEVETFFETMPKLSHKVKVTNPETKVESEVVIEGLASFFS